MDKANIHPVLAFLAPSTLPSGTLHSPAGLLVFWAAAFVSLCLAVAGLSLFLDQVESDSELLTLGKELVLALAASAIEGTVVWLLAAFAPGAIGRGILLPLVVVGMLYQVAHYDSWGRYEAGTLLVFQIVIVVSAVALVLGQFQLAFMVVGACILFLGIFLSIVRRL